MTDDDSCPSDGYYMVKYREEINNVANDEEFNQKDGQAEHVTNPWNIY